MANTPTLNASRKYRITKLRGFREGAADHATMIEDASANALARAEPLVVPKSLSNLYVSRPVAIPAGVDFWMEGDSKINYTGSAQSGAIVTVGTPGTINNERQLRINVIRQAYSNWADPTHVGLLIHDCQQSVLDIGATGFTVGTELRGTDRVAFNDVHLQRLITNRYGVKLRAAGVSGWVNENKFYGGRFSCDSIRRQQLGYPTTYGPIGFWLSGDFNGINSNTFFKQSFEINASDSNPSGVGCWMESACVVFDAPRSSDNHWRDVRHENSEGSGAAQYYGTKFFRFDAPDCTGNTAELGYSSSTYREHPIVTSNSGIESAHGMIEYRCGGGQLGNTVRRRTKNAAAPRSSWHSGNLGSITKRCNAAGSIMTPGMYWQTNGNRRQHSYVTTHTVPNGAGHIVFQPNDTLAMMVATGNAKRISIKPNVPDGGANFLRVWATALDSSKAVLSNSAAQLTPTIVGGVITAVDITGGIGGKGYSGAPAYRIYGGSGSGAVLTINMTGDTISSVTVVNGGSGYSNSTVIAVDPPPIVDLMMAGALPSTYWGYPGWLTQAASDESRLLVVGPRTKFVEIGFTSYGGASHLESIEIRPDDDAGQLQYSTWEPGWSDRPFALEAPQASWLTNGGNWQPGSFVANYANPGDTTTARAMGWLYCGGTTFKAV